MPDDPISTGKIEAIRGFTAASQQAQAAQKLSQYAIAQESASEEFEEWGDLNAFNPLALAKKFESLDSRIKRRGREEEGSEAKRKEEGEAEIVPVEQAQETAEDYHRRNPELQARSLLLLRSRIKPGDSLEEIMRKVREVYPDPAQADESLEFLAETAAGELKKNFGFTREELNRLLGREVRAGRNINAQAREFSSQGLGSPTALRDLYRELLTNPREPQVLFQELTASFPFDKMKAVIDFILHSLGSDLKAKGPSITRAELTRLVTEARTLQAILGVYRFFKSRMRMIGSSFERQGLPLPPRVTFDTLSKIFMKFIQERYPSVEKALQFSQQLGISGQVLAQIIIYVQFRDAMRQTAPKLFKNDQHRQEMLMCFMEVLEELDEELEEEEKKEEEKKGG